MRNFLMDDIMEMRFMVFPYRGLVVFRVFCWI